MKFGAPLRDKPFGDYSGSGDYLRTFKEGASLVRFIYPLNSDGWVGYFEHYNAGIQRSVPCLRDEDGDTSKCPACNSDNKNFRYASRKIGTNILLVDKDIVLPFKLSQTLLEKLERRCEKDGGDITKRDYTLTRVGKDQKTDYDVDKEDAYEVDFKELQAKAQPIGPILEANFEEYWAKNGDKPATDHPADEAKAEDRERKASSEEDPPPF